METNKALNIANMLLGIGILLLVVPIGFTIVTLSTPNQNQSVAEALMSFGWIYIVVMSMLPLGLGAFVGGLTWMTHLKRKMKAEDIDADDEKGAAENQ